MFQSFSEVLVIKMKTSIVAVFLWLVHAKITFSKSPNIVMILTDDQDSVLQGMTPLTKTKNLIAQKGITFDNMFVTSPLCCPSRSSILTGQYVHNHRAINNSVTGNCSSIHWQQGPEKRSMGVYLKQLNYITFFAGKYLNQYGRPETGGPEHVPPGWDQWYGLVGNSKYYHYTLSVNGKPEKHGSDYEKDYFTDVIRRHAVNFVQNQVDSSPFFMLLSTPACHEPDTPAPHYKDAYSGMKSPRTASYNIPGGKGKHWLIRQAPNPMANSSVEQSDEIFRNRWRTLLSVDDLVSEMVSTLAKIKQLDNTYIIFTSDNGYHLGQFSLPLDKRQLYEFDIRVPFLISGPGIPQNKHLKNPILSIDIAPTVIELAGGKQPETMDGQSIVPLLKSDMDKWRQDFLVEHSGEGNEKVQGCPQLTPGFECCHPNCVCEDSWNNTYSCVRTLTGSENTMYCEIKDNEGFVEFYDLDNDPDQLDNIVNTLKPAELITRRQRLQDLMNCKGNTCRESKEVNGHF